MNRHVISLGAVFLRTPWLWFGFENGAESFIEWFVDLEGSVAAWRCLFGFLKILHHFCDIQGRTSHFFIFISRDHSLPFHSVI